jgi:HEAT repeat protein
VAEAGKRTIGDLLSARDEGADAYRQAELARLETCLADSGPLVAWIHGADGHGKSSLLKAFCERAEAAGAAAIRIDCRTVEPTAAGLLGVLGELHDPGAVEFAREALADPEPAVREAAASALGRRARRRSYRRASRGP